MIDPQPSHIAEPALPATPAEPVVTARPIVLVEADDALACVDELCVPAEATR
ncbi:MAG TPA: hypothetical protein VGK16_11380 [Candidatus Limnocylindrales bacterium]